MSVYVLSTSDNECHLSADLLAAACVGFTWYPSATLGGPPAKALSECCFRTGSVAGARSVAGPSPGGRPGARGHDPSQRRRAAAAPKVRAFTPPRLLLLGGPRRRRGTH